MIRKVYIIFRCILFTSLAFTSCKSSKSRKDVDFAITIVEARKMQMKLKSSTLPINTIDLENIIKSSAETNIFRWEASTTPEFLIKSKKTHPISAGSHVKKFWFIDQDFGIVFSH